MTMNPAYSRVLAAMATDILPLMKRGCRKPGAEKFTIERTCVEAFSGSHRLDIATTTRPQRSMQRIRISIRGSQASAAPARHTILVRHIGDLCKGGFHSRTAPAKKREERAHIMIFESRVLRATA